MSAGKTDDPVKTPASPGGESPTTARPLDMDDDDVPQESGVVVNDPPANPPAAATETTEGAPPPKPPRPLNPQQEAENTLKEAFPSIDLAVIKAVLSASGGKVEPAFNALLGMTDPDAAVEPLPPPQPPRPAATGGTPLSQLEADELYARQLAEHYDGAGRYPPTGQQQRSRGAGVAPQPRNSGEKEYSFIDDDLPVIRDNIKKGFLETQSRVNGWIKNLQKRIDGEDVEGGPSQPGQGPRPYGARRSGDIRRSGDYNRYDADPQEIGDDFAGIQLNDDSQPPPQPRRPLANPYLFKPTPPKPTDGRKVSFQDDDNLYESSPTTAPKEPASTGKQSKWQPLSTVDPSPIAENENDPFALEDSEDENPSKDRVGGKEINKDDAERLKKAAAESTAATPGTKPEPAETTGTKDKLAQEALSKS